MNESRFPLMQVLLACSSDFFSTLFKYDNDGKKEYRLRGIRPDAFRIILNWIYKHHLSLTKDNVDKVLKAADYLACMEVVAQCHDFISRCSSGDVGNV